MWFRRDLRINDNPALAAADAHGEKTACMVMIDDALWNTWGTPKQAYLVDSLTELDKSLSGNLIVRRGDPIKEVLEVALAAKADKVFCAPDFTTAGIVRDKKVKEILAANGIDFEFVGSNYAVAPGRIRKADETPYRVYTPFYKAWLQHGWRAPLQMELRENWLKTESHELPKVEMPAGMERSISGEYAALERFDYFLKTGVKDYKLNRDRADLDGTSRLSIALKWGEIHPRTILAELGDSEGEETYRKEIAWREFYADVLFHNPTTDKEYLNPAFADMKYDTGEIAESRFEAWKQGKTGYPFVDAGMRQLIAEGWMHNRVRMVTASFFVKDLHLEWQQGAAWFFELLKDADVASNQHGWQWTAGCGTDAAPYFRIFNPITQGLRFDPNGDYVRKYIPELRHIDGSAVHEPWLQGDGYLNGYAKQIVDHAIERDESLARYQAIKKN